jgi:MFS family permease
MSQNPSQSNFSSEEGFPSRWLALPVILTGVLLVIGDVFILCVATPKIQESLNATFGQSQLIVAGYHLVYAVFLITGGHLGDIYGRKKLFILGMAGFTVSSALCGLANSAVFLIFARIFQGIAAALLFPQILSMIRVLFPLKERQLAFGMCGGVLGLASVVGQLASGIIIHFNWFGLEWRPIFFVNIPIGLVAMFFESKVPRITLR